MNAPTTYTKVLVALGGNVDSVVGSPEKTIHAAIARLGDSQLLVEAVSPFYATPCFPAGAGPDYVNAAVLLSGPDAPQTVLETLHRIEAEFGRQRRQRWGRRTLDLDLIAMGQAVLPDVETFNVWKSLPPDQQSTATPDKLILPHPRLQDRAFVLIPLADVAPDWRHPMIGKTVAEMAAALPEEDKTSVRRL